MLESKYNIINKKGIEMLKIVLCEDEKQQREIIKNYIHDSIINHTKEYEILEFESSEDMLENYPKSTDILILDIQMGNINGMDAARKIREFDENVEIIFITGLWDYLQEGYEVRAYRYLIKPIKYDSFNNQFGSCIENILEYNKKYILATYKGESNKISINSILYIETEGRNIIIYTDKKSYLSNIGINKIERELGLKKFFRCHNSYLVNLDYITKIGTNSVFIDEYEVPVSRHKIKELKIQFTNSLGDKL